MKKKPKQLKEFLQKESLQKVYKEKIIVKKENTFIKLLSFFIDLFGQIIKILFIVLIIALSSIGATYLINNIEKFNL